MKPKKIGIIMEKSKLRRKVLLALQKIGYHAYVIPEDEELYVTIEEMNLDFIILHQEENEKTFNYLDEIKLNEEIKTIPVVVIVDRKTRNTDILEMLRKGAIDAVYIKELDINPLVETVEKFMKYKRSNFHLKIMEVEDVVVFSVMGNLDITNSHKINSVFNKYFAKGSRDFVIDISKLDYLESVGLGILIHIQKKLSEHKGDLKLVTTSQKILKLFTLVKLDKYFEIYRSVDDIITIPDAKKKIKAVVIDDAKFMRKLISAVLESEGFEVDSYESAIDALEVLEKSQPDIILVDYEMPKMNGLEFIEKFKPHIRDIPTIMLTGETDINVALKAMRSGASDFLNKPFKEEELIHIIKKIVRENKLKKENQRLFMELKRREKELERKNMEISKLYNELEEELEMASEIQKNLLPEKFPDIKDFKFAVKYMPSQDIGGDFYDIVEMSNGYYGLAFADVSGHGIPAALLSTMFKVYLMTYSKDVISPSEAMEELNEIVAEAFPDGKFISLFYIVIDSKDGSMKYCKAAQEPALHMKKSGEIVELESEGQVLGLFSEKDMPGLLNFQEKEISLESGDKIFLYTDGIIEAQNKREEFYGLERLKKILNINNDKNADALIEVVYEDLLDFMEGLPVLDDLTLLVIEKE